MYIYILPFYKFTRKTNVIEIEIDERDRDILTDVALNILLNQYLSLFKIVSFIRIIFL